jgi:hypothetical protein
MKFLLYENVRVMISKNPSRPSFLENIVTGGAVSAVVTAGVHPIDTIKTRMSVLDRASSRTVRAAVAEIVAAEGPRGLLRGLSPALMSSVPFSAINMATFMTTKDMYKDWAQLPPVSAPPITVLLSLSVLSTLAAQLVAYPIFSVKVWAGAWLFCFYLHGPCCPSRRVAGAQSSRTHGQPPFLTGGPFFSVACVACAGQQLADRCRIQMHLFYPLLLRSSGEVNHRRELLTRVRGWWHPQVNIQSGRDAATWPSITRIVRERGVLGLYRGMGLNFLKSAPAVGVTFTAYEYSKPFLGIGA